MKTNILIKITLFCIANFTFIINAVSNDPPGIFQEEDCVEMAVRLYDELIYQEVGLIDASQAAFDALLECEAP